jgi:hypothetical protein
VASDLVVAIMTAVLGGQLPNHVFRPPASWKGPERAIASISASQSLSGETDWSVELSNTSELRNGGEIRELSVLVWSDTPPLLSKPPGWIRRVEKRTERLATEDIPAAVLGAVAYTVTWTPEDAARGLAAGETFRAHFWTSLTASATGCVVVFRNATTLRLQWAALPSE